MIKHSIHFPMEPQSVRWPGSNDASSNQQDTTDEALERQFKKCRMKEEIVLRKQYANATEEYGVAIFFMNSFTHLSVGR